MDHRRKRWLTGEDRRVRRYVRTYVRMLECHSVHRSSSMNCAENEAGLRGQEPPTAWDRNGRIFEVRRKKVSFWQGYINLGFIDYSQKWMGHVTRIRSISITSTTLLEETEVRGHFTYLTLDGSIILSRVVRRQVVMVWWDSSRLGELTLSVSYEYGNEHSGYAKHV